MARPIQILGLNSREQLYKSLNSVAAKTVANSKLLTKEVMEKQMVPVPKSYAVFSTMDEVNAFKFDEITTSFVIKPSGGSGGKGILIIRKKGQKDNEWIGVDGKPLSTDDLRLHIGDILEGQYDTFGSTHQAFVEERVPIHPKFKKYTVRGTPDIRVIVYNKVPVMSMLRLPTKESEGKANLHQGAIGVGIDIATGVTLTGVHHGNMVRFVPNSKRKLNGIRIPKWTLVLKTAVDAAVAAGLSYSGIDLLIHPDRGPLIVELNASPGLAIQLANRSGLRWRLERVEGLAIRDTDHGVRVGKALFAEMFADKVKAEEGLTIVDTFETIRLRDSQKNFHDVGAIIDTGSYRSAIGRNLAQDYGLLNPENILWERTIGKTKSQVIDVSFYIKGRKVKSAMTVTNRGKNSNKVLVGRLDLQGFVVNPQLKKD